MPKETFEVVTAPEGDHELVNCEPIQVTIQAKAGQATGPIEGHFTWFIENRSIKGVGEGLVAIPLFVKVVE